MSNWDDWDDGAEAVIKPHNIPTFQSSGGSNEGWGDFDNAAWGESSNTTWREPNNVAWRESNDNGNRHFNGRGRRGGRNDFSRGRSDFNRGGKDGSNRGVNSEGKFSRDRNIPRENENCEVLKIPTRYIGRIIGRGGSKINELQDESGARIQVTKEIEFDDTIVKLFGNESAIAKAKKLVFELSTDTIKFVEPSAPKPQSVPEKKMEIINWDTLLKECDEAAAAEWAKYPPINKYFYKPHPDVLKMTPSEVEQFREANNNIVVDRTFKNENSAPIPKPCPTFYHAFYDYPEVLDEIQKAGFETPSPIQAQAWPILLSGEDLIGIAQTGTGKTLAFLLPALIHIDGQPGRREDRGGPAVLVMAPTRELALQIDKEVKKYEYRGITSVCVYGGGSRKDQVKLVTDGVDIVIATPGRLNDLFQAGLLNVKTVTYIVLDEADRMLDMGFEPQIRKVMYSIRPTRQTVMTSATWPVGVRRLADSYMVDPIQVYVGTLDLAATHTVTQIIQILPEGEDAKMETFLEFARNLGPDQKVIVFCGKKARADELASELACNGISCQSIHGDRDQADREQALVDIKDGTVKILVATDVASRGLDIDDITHVVNYDFPKNVEEYVHRVGRTGRAGKLGESISYFTRTDWAQAKELIKILEEAEQFVPEELHQMAERFEAARERKERQGGGRGGRGGSRFGGGGRRSAGYSDFF